MKKFYNELNKELELYELTKIQRATLYQQAVDVYLNLENKEIDSEFIQEIIEDIFEFNEINKVPRNKKKSKNKLFWGIILICVSLMLLFTNFSVWTVLVICAIPTIVYMLLKRQFIISMILLYAIINTFLNINDITLLISLIIGYLGIRLIFSKKHENIKYYKFKNYKSESDVVQNEKEVLFLDNRFGETKMDITDEKITYINLENKFGGCELDLTNFNFLLGDLTINTDNSFGGITLYINENTEVELRISSSFGGTSSKANNSNPSHIVYIQGDNKFGGIEIKNKKNT